MARRTISDRLCAALIARGHRETTHRSRKYRAFEKEPGGDCYYVGRGGALRVGRTATESFSLERTALRAALLREVPERD